MTEIICDSCREGISNYALGGVLWFYDYNLKLWSKPIITHNSCSIAILGQYIPSDVKYILLEKAIEPDCFAEFINYLDDQSVKILIERISIPIANYYDYDF